MVTGDLLYTALSFYGFLHHCQLLGYILQGDAAALFSEGFASLFHNSTERLFEFALKRHVLFDKQTWLIYYLVDTLTIHASVGVITSFVFFSELFSQFQHKIRHFVKTVGITKYKIRPTSEY